ncbi:MAG: hypothetical protein ACXWK8_04630, partial [Myxococcaceae bacterium]
MRTVLLLALLQSPLSALAAPTPAPTSSESTDGRELAANPVPQILRSAEDAHQAVRRIGEQSEKRALIDDVHARLPAIVGKIAPLASEEALISHRDIADLRPALLRADLTLASWDADLEAAVR